MVLVQHGHRWSRRARATVSRRRRVGIGQYGFLQGVLPYKISHNLVLTVSYAYQAAKCSINEAATAAGASRIGKWPTSARVSRR